MTSEGQATRGARRLLQRMAHRAQAPDLRARRQRSVGALHLLGAQAGQINLAYESMRMAVPGVRFLGMSAFDYKKFKLTSAAEIKLTKEDITRAEQMKAYPWFKDKKWQREIQAMLDNGFKMEVDALLTKSICFITEEYIPKKLQGPRLPAVT